MVLISTTAAITTALANVASSIRAILISACAGLKRNRVDTSKQKTRPQAQVLPSSFELMANRQLLDDSRDFKEWHSDLVLYLSAKSIDRERDRGRRDKQIRTFAAVQICPAFSSRHAIQIAQYSPLA